MYTHTNEYKNTHKHMYATSVGTWVNGSSPRNMNHVTNVAENTST